jgi:ATP-dependent exoDNAse (exonuclease V) alpha subunit
MSFSLNADQLSAVEKLTAFIGNPAPDTKMFGLSGPAGSGKTTLLKRAQELLGSDAKVTAPTNKAVSILRSKGFPKACTLSSVLDTWTAVKTVRPPNTLELAYFASTGIPAPTEIAGTEFVRDDDEKPFRVILIDESSMVSLYDHGRLVESGAKVVCVGDGSQLPPVLAEGWFQDFPYDVTLTKNMRQGEASEIHTLCTELRDGNLIGAYTTDRWKTDVTVTKKANIADIADCDMTLAFSNAECNELNTAIRANLGLIDPNMPTRPMRGSKLLSWMTSKHNNIAKSVLYTCVNHGVPILRGQHVVGFFCDLVDANGIKFNGIAVSDVLLANQKLGLDLCAVGTIAFSFGHCITGHKSQGDEADHVAVIIPSYLTRMTDHERWVYTVCSRARKSLIIAHGWKA